MTLKEEYEKANKQIELSDYILKNDVLTELILADMVFDGDYHDKIQPPQLIVHGGGTIGGSQVTNSKEALDFNYYKGSKFFELDFIWTSDNKPVVFHDWDYYFDKYFEVEPKVYSHNEFMHLTMINNWHQMDLESLVQWLREHKDVYIISDAKEKNIELLTLIKNQYPDVQDQFIPQIYYMGEYIQAEYIGYDKLIYTLYKSADTEEEVTDFIMRNNVFAVAMPNERVGSYYKELYKKEDLFIYTHIVNDVEEAKSYMEKGIDGFYTDDLTADMLEKKE